MSGEAVVELVGNVGGDPELRWTSAGDAVAAFSVAVTPRRKQGSEWVDEDTQWYRVSVWKQDAEAVTEHVKRGAKVRVQGRLRPSLFEGQKGPRLSLDVTALRNGVTIIPKPTQVSQGQDPWS